MFSSLRRVFPRTSQRQPLRTLRRDLTRTRSNAPMQPVSLPLEVIQKIIDDHLSDPKDAPTLWKLALTCHPMAAYCRPILYRVLRLKIDPSSGPQKVKAFPPAVWEHAQELHVFLWQFGQDQEGGLPGEWIDLIEKLRQAPRLKVAQCTVGSEPLGPFTSRAFGTLLFGLQHLEALTLQAPASAALRSLVAGMGPEAGSCLSTLKSLTAVCHTHNNYSHLFAGGEGFDIALLDEGVTPGEGSLQHLQLGLWRSFAEGFGQRERIFVHTYSHTLRCLHLGDRIHCSDEAIQVPILFGLDLRVMHALEWLEVLTIFSALRGALKWISESVSTLPLEGSRPKLKVSLLLNCNTVAIKLRDESDSLSPYALPSIWKEDRKFDELVEHPGVDLVGFLRIYEEGRTVASAPRCLGRYGAGVDINDGPSYKDFWRGCLCSGWTFKA